MPENLEQRRRRLQRVLEPICDRNEFTSQDIQLVCHEMTPQFVTQILNQLAQEGILQCEASGPKRFFRWQQARDSFVPHAWINRQLTTQLTAAPAEDRPRERLLSLGADKLRTAELIAILIRTGRKGESALMAGEKVATHFASDIGRIRDASPAELKEISSVVSSGVYCQIMAGIELGGALLRPWIATNHHQRKSTARQRRLIIASESFGDWRLTVNKRSFTL